MRCAIVNHDAKSGYRKTDQAAFRHHRLESFMNGSDEFLRNRPAINLVDEFKVSFFQRLNISCDSAVLSGAAGLLFMGIVELGFARDGLEIGNLWSSCFNFGGVFTLHAFDIHIQVQLTHSRNDRFARFFVNTSPERWIFLREPLQSLREVGLRLLVLCLDAQMDDWVR